MTLKNRKYQISFKKTGSKKKRTYNLKHRKLTKKTIIGGKWPWSKESKKPELGHPLTNYEIKKGKEHGLFAVTYNPLFDNTGSVALPANKSRVPLSANPLYASADNPMENVQRSPNPLYESGNKEKLIKSESNNSGTKQSLPVSPATIKKKTNPLYVPGGESLHVNSNTRTHITTSEDKKKQQLYQNMKEPQYEEPTPLYETVKSKPLYENMEGPKQKPEKGKFTRISKLTPVEEDALKTADEYETLVMINNLLNPTKKINLSTIPKSNIYKLDPTLLKEYINDKKTNTKRIIASQRLLSKYYNKILNNERRLEENAKQAKKESQSINTSQLSKSTGVNSSVNNPTYESRTYNSALTTTSNPYYMPRNIAVYNTLPGPPVPLKTQIPDVVSSGNNA